MIRSGYGLKRKKEDPIGPPFNNLQEIETNTVFSDRVCFKDEEENGGLPVFFEKNGVNSQITDKQMFMS